MHRKQGENKLTPIDKLIDWDKRKGKWVFSEKYYEFIVAHYWRLTPSEWEQRGEDEKALMMAFYNARNMMADYENYLDEMKRT